MLWCIPLAKCHYPKKTSHSFFDFCWIKPRTQDVAKKMFNLGMKFLRLYKALCFLHVRRGHVQVWLGLGLVHILFFWGSLHCCRDGEPRWLLKPKAHAPCLLRGENSSSKMGIGHKSYLYTDVQQHMQGSQTYIRIPIQHIVYIIYTLNLQKPFKSIYDSHYFTLYPYGLSSSTWIPECWYVYFLGCEVLAHLCHDILRYRILACSGACDAHCIKGRVRRFAYVSIWTVGAVWATKVSKLP